MPETAADWLEALKVGDSALALRLRRACGVDEALTPDRLDPYTRALETFARTFGPGRPVEIVRVPGRLNTLGRHADHRGGYVNPMALAQEVVLVFSPLRDPDGRSGSKGPGADDLVDVVSLDASYGRRTFRISDRRPREGLRDLHAWLDWTQELVADRTRESRAHDWEHKLAAPAAYLAHFVFPGRALRGLSGVITAQLPARVGLSSSSAVVIAMMLATARVNGLTFEDRELVDHCGKAEWYVGTRGGSGDHAAIICAKAGHITQVRTTPVLKVAGYTPFPPDLRFLVFHSGFDADKTGAAGNTFNERTATYEIAEMLAAKYLRRHHAGLWRTFVRERVSGTNAKVMHLGDIVEQLNSAEMLAMLETIPERVGREGLRELLADEPEGLQRQFATHRELPRGYRLRGVLLFGLAECSRSARWPAVLRTGEIDRIGRMMNISHDGDRVSGRGTDRAGLKSRVETHLPVWEHPGGYDCSTPEIDAMVDIALSAGAIGAQVTAAGLGGSMMALVAAGGEDQVVRAMTENYFIPRRITPNHLVATPSAGAALV